MNRKLLAKLDAFVAMLAHEVDEERGPYDDPEDNLVWREWKPLRAEIVAERCENCSRWGSPVMDGDKPAEAGWHYCIEHADGDRGLLARYDGGVTADEVCTAPDFCCAHFTERKGG